MPTDAPAKISIVIAGGAPTTSTNVFDLLVDWLRLDTDNPVDAFIYLPGDERYISKVVKYAADFCLEAALNYDVIDGAKIGPKAKEIKRGANSVIGSDAGDDMPGDLIAVLAEDEANGYVPYLIVAWGADVEAPDDFTMELVAAAFEANIPVLEIAARGLDEIIPGEGLVDRAAAVEEGQQATETVQAATERHPAGHLDAEIDAAAQDEPETLEQVLAWVYAFLSHQDRANAAVNMAEPFERPLTLAVQRQLYKLAEAEWHEMAEIKQQAAGEQTLADIGEAMVEASEEPATRGRSRARKGEVAVLVDEAGEIVAFAGRGRPSDGLTRKIVTAAEAAAVLAVDA